MIEVLLYFMHFQENFQYCCISGIFTGIGGKRWLVFLGYIQLSVWLFANQTSAYALCKFVP